MLNKKALAASVSAPPSPFIEDVFSTYVYTGNGSGSGGGGVVQTITNGIDLSGKGGLTWIKNRGRAATSHGLYDTVRGALNGLSSDTTGAQSAYSNTLNGFTSSGFTLGDDSSNTVNLSGDRYCSWTFRKQSKFFDMVTYTGNQTNRTIAHNLGSVPGMIIIICVSAGGYDKHVYHRSLANTEFLSLNTTNAKGTGANRWNSTTATATEFSLGTDTTVNATGDTFIAYLFAHNAGGFGTAGTDNVISCGSYTGTATAGNTINLGFEPQWIMIKQAAGSDAGSNSWSIYDTMRGMPNGNSNDNRLEANNSDAEVGFPEIAPTATGFVCEATGGRLNASGGTYIYMAIRRPMKVPTVGTSVFSPIKEATGGTQTLTTGFPVDLSITKSPGAGNLNYVFDRLRGSSRTSSVLLKTESTDAESSVGYGLGLDNNTGLFDNVQATTGTIFWNFRRASGFMDVVCYTGNGTALSVNHNLGVAPQIIIAKRRNSTSNWAVTVGGNIGYNLNTTTQVAFAGGGLDVAGASSTTFQADYLQDYAGTVFNISGATYVAYLFATCAGVSKVGSYTGNGSSQTINCGFTAGARFVLIKRTDASGDWVTLDTARGIVSGNDPFLQLNSTAAEVTGEDIVDPDNSGFIVNSTTENINASGGTYIYLAIA
jgi:hypothetical protein